MKKVFSICLVIALIVGITATVSAQGNLQFNQAKFIELSVVVASGSNYPSAQQSITIPTGKIWKIESSSASVKNIGNGSYGTSSAVNLTLNDKIIFSTLGSSATSTVFIGNTYPIWLPAGTYNLSLQVLCTSCGSGSNFLGYVSGIEFNITQ